MQAVKRRGTGLVMRPVPSKMTEKRTNYLAAFPAAFFFFLIWLLTTLKTAVPKMINRMARLTGRVRKIM